jgi:hypothetical protein
MGAVAIHDPEGDRLIRLAESLGGAENLSEGERWRLANTLDRRRKLEARATQPDGRTDALSSQVVERRFAAIEAECAWARGMLQDGLPQVVGEVIGEAEQRCDDEAKRLVDELRGETDQKLNAQFAGFETAVSELRNEDRAALLTTVRETMSEAESRIDSNLGQALEKTWERCELEVAFVRDELLNVMAEKKYGQLTDDAPKLELAEKAIASLRKRTTALEDENARMAARGDQFAGMAASLATLEDAYRQSTKSLLIRCAANHLAARKETARANELADKVGRLETKLEELTEALLARKVIR